MGYCDSSPEVHFRYEGGGHAARVQPFAVRWRRLPYGLLESPEGGQWVLEIQGQAPATVESGEIMVIPPGAYHRFHMAGAQTMFSTWSFVSFEGSNRRDLLVSAGVPHVLPKPTGLALTKLILRQQALDESVAGGDLAALAKRHQLGFAMLELLLAQAQTQRLAPPDPEMKRLLPVLHYVDTNLNKAVSVEELARQAYLSPSRFHSVFLRAMGISPMSYVQQARLRAAQRLLLTSTLPVAEIALQTGFASPYYFSRAFRRHAGNTPTAFRRDFSSYWNPKAPPSSC